MILRFSEWDNRSVNESSSMDKIMNWLSSNFGGSISKIDNLLSKINTIETKYIKDWNEIQTEIDALDIQKGQTKNDAAEYKKLERMIDRNRGLISALNKKKAAEIAKIDNKVEEIVGENSKLISYWNSKKSRLEADLAEKIYKISKDLTDETVSDELYRKYKKALISAKEKDANFVKKFGRLDFSKSVARDDEEEVYNLDRPKFSLDPILAMNAAQFTKYVQGLEKSQIKVLIKVLMTERNERYAFIDTERDRLEASGVLKGSENKDASKAFKDFRENLMRQIRDLRTKITIARRYE
jgi:hypothetical protein